MGARPGVRRLREAAEVLAVTVAAALALKTFVVDAVLVPSASMEDTILPGDFLLVNKFVYGPSTPRHVPFWRGTLPVLRLPGPGSPHRGDVIVFFAPDAAAPRLYVKRLAALPGDTLSIRGGTVFVDGRPVRPAAHAKLPGGNTPDFGPVGVPADSCFVLGDNLDESLDSRSWGFVPLASVIGRPIIVYWSVSPGGDVRWGRIFTIVR